MKKTLRIACCLCLSILMFNFISLSAKAVETDSSETIIYNPANYLPSYPRDKARVAPGMERLLFQMKAVSLTGLRSSYAAGNYFDRESLPADSYIFYLGKLTGNSPSISAGICTKNVATGETFAEHRTYFPAGQFTESKNIAVSSLSPGRTYYGFINEHTGSNPINGYVQFFYWDFNA